MNNLIVIRLQEPEAAAVVANNVPKTEVTENGIADDAPKSAPPAVPADNIQAAPAITEDVTSVTKVHFFPPEKAYSISKTYRHDDLSRNHTF